MRSARIAVTALVVLLLGGIWVFVAPFGLGLQPAFSPWTTATRNDLATGGVLIVTALGALIAYGALAVRGVLAKATQQADQSAPESFEAEGQVEPVEPGS